ncbi:SpoIID/LytB domain-containing protein [Georgenia thermotolerans]|uniref:SpoIID/LytB domain-containing protein n=1 Tax=Georgenia thermotolerans TaxID=527326 RepID=A0A7J5UQR5_9MICO|nr:SpoIID/LytB domain-containing protein [Georgenia thermotolerans]KAE8764550.1 SpoIID/LytB domain-containing protein [Georgenia thermotolerans]
MGRKIRGFVGAVLSAGLAVGGVVATSSGAAAEEAIYPPPASGYWDVRGHGWGHGKGLSQWGAQGAAQQGLSADQILAFYYPGTTKQNVGNDELRVQLRSFGTPSKASFWSTSGTGGPLTAADTTLAGKVTITLDAAGWIIERPGQSTVRRTGNTLDVRATPGADYGTGVVLADSPTATTGTYYHGYFRLVRIGSTNTFDVVNHVGMQLYLYGVVPREMPASWRPAAVQAQAVAARTYALSVKRSTGHFDLCDTDQCQVYGGRADVSDTGATVFMKEDARASDAVEKTYGHARWYGGAAAFTQFSSSNGGYSRGDSTRPYLAARPDPYSGVATGDPVSSWTARLPVSAVQAHCPAGGSLQRLVITSRDGRGDLGGRITGARVECTSGSATLPNNEAVFRFGLRSSWWAPVEPPQPRYLIHLNNSFTGYADTAFNFGDRTDTFLVGDWDGRNGDSLAIRRGNVFHFRNSNTSGVAEKAISYGNPGDTILVGDWDGDGVDTFAVRRGNQFHVKNSISSGYADRVIAYGNPGDEIVVGDWDGDGVDTFAVRRGNQFHVKNSISSGYADRVLYYGNPGDTLVVGNWDGKGGDSLGVRRGNVYHLRNSLTSGDADRVVTYGNPTDEVLLGDWDGNGTDTLGIIRR